MYGKRLFLVCSMAFIVTFATACKTETLVTKVDPTKPETQRTDGVLFSLPETVIIAEVPLTKVASSPGVFSSWTEFFYPELTTDNFVTEEKTAFKIGTPTFSTRGQTDPNHVYIAHIKAKQFETKSLLVELSEDGIIVREEASSKDESIDIITSGIKTAASIVAPLLPFGAGADAFNKSLDVPVDCEARVEAAKAAAKKAADARVAADTAAAIAATAAPKALGAATAAARAADEIADAAELAAAVEAAAVAQCYDKHLEDLFKEQLSKRELALYQSLDDAYKAFLRNTFGYDFLTYVAKKETSGSILRSANIEFFFTLSEKQQKLLADRPRSTVSCVGGTAGTKCLAANVKIELLKAKAVFDKIQRLRQQREEFLAETTPAQVNSSTNLEFRLKELDAQISGTENTYFLGTSTETSATAKFEFKPSVGAVPHSLFTYAAGGSKPGICKDGVTSESATFKAIWPQKLGGASCHALNSLFEFGDFRDLEQLRLRLRAVAAPLPPGATPDNVSIFLYGQLTPGTQALLLTEPKTPQAKKNLLTALMTDLNAVLSGPSIFPLVDFSQVKLSTATLDLLGKPAPLPAEVVQLNRSLIEDAYTKEIYRQAAWVSHQISLVVDPAPPGIASAVLPVTPANANALEPGKRGFPYRVAASTVAKLQDDGKELGRGAVRIAQFGPVRTLPANLGGRRSSYKITYYDATGAIKIFNMEADALIQKQNITDLTDAATTLRDAEAAKLKRETELINAKKAKLEAEKALKAAQGTPSPTPTPE